MQKGPKEVFDESLEFLRLLRDFENIERTIYRPDDRKENDIEHSYQVAMFAWFLSSRFGLSLSLEKLLAYGLVHDLVEVYAGDTPVYNREHSPNTVATKKEREEKALLRIKKEFHHFNGLTDAIHAYETKSDDESIFIYEIDKLLPALNIYLDGGYGWRKLDIVLSDVQEEKRTKVKSTKQLVSLLEEALARFEQEEEHLFARKSK